MILNILVCLCLLLINKEISAQSGLGSTVWNDAGEISINFDADDPQSSDLLNTALSQPASDFVVDQLQARNPSSDKFPEAAASAGRPLESVGKSVAPNPTLMVADPDEVQSAKQIFEKMWKLKSEELASKNLEVTKINFVAVEDKKEYEETPGVGKGVVFKVEVDKPIKLDDVVKVNKKYYASEKPIKEDGESLLQAEQQEYKMLKELTEKLYANRFAVTDIYDSRGNRTNGQYEYNVMHYFTRRIFCQSFDCIYGVCYVEDARKIAGIDETNAVRHLLSDWNLRVSNPNVAFNPENSNVVVYRSPHDAKNCVTRVVKNDSEKDFTEEVYCTPEHGIGKNKWSPYVFTPLQFSFIELMHQNLGHQNPSRSELHKIANLLLTCACYKGFYGENCSDCDCAATPGIHQIPLEPRELEKKEVFIEPQ